MLKTFQMESQNVSWLVAMYEAMFSRGEKKKPQLFGLIQQARRNVVPHSKC